MVRERRIAVMHGLSIRNAVRHASRAATPGAGSLASGRRFVLWRRGAAGLRAPRHERRPAVTSSSRALATTTLVGLRTAGVSHLNVLLCSATARSRCRRPTLPHLAQRAARVDREHPPLIATSRSQRPARTLATRQRVARAIVYRPRDARADAPRRHRQGSQQRAHRAAAARARPPRAPATSSGVAKGWRRVRRQRSAGPPRADHR